VSLKSLIGYCIALAVPVLCYLVIRQITAATVQMPGYYIVDHVDSAVHDGAVKYDTVYHQLGDFALTNQLGHSISVADIAGKIVLANFFCTSCAAATPAAAANLRKVQIAFAKNDSALQILSISADPEKDSVPRLKAFADHLHADHDTWWFLTGDKNQVLRLAAGGFHIFAAGSDRNGFPDAGRWVLLDKHRFIRGYYNGLDSSDIKRCVNDIALLMLEKEKR